MKGEIYITTTRYDDGYAPFPEAEHWDKYVAAEIAALYPGASIVVEYGTTQKVTAYGFGHDIPDVERDVRGHVSTTLWDDFCCHGYKQFTEVK